MKSPLKPLFLLILAGLFTLMQANGQVAVNDDGSAASSSAMLDVKSTSKGLLIPRVALTGTTSNAPIGSGVTTSMMVYNTATTSDVIPGYYMWTGIIWERMQTNGAKPLKEISSSTSLTKSDNLVLAGGDITITLPEITSTDDGLAITIKADGSYMDYVIVQGYNGATIDDHSSSVLFYENGRTYVAEGGNWITTQREDRRENTYIVEPSGSWRNLDQIFEFLGDHMTGPSLIMLGGGDFEVTTTLNVDFAYPITIQGLSYGETYIVPTTALGNNPMFDCVSECYFKFLYFDGEALPGYGTTTGQDAIHLSGTNTYHEIKDSYFIKFYKGLVITNNVDLWMFDVDFEGIASTAFEVNSTVAGVKLRISNTDFIDCRKGLDLANGEDIYLSMTGCGFDLTNPTDVGIIYQPSATMTYSSMYITGNTWNNTGTFYTGFDFSRTDGRDAMIYVERNAGASDENPHYKENVINNNSNTTLTNANTWYKASWTTTSKIVSSWNVNNNTATFLSKNKRDIIVYISGNLSVNNSNRSISIALVKNGISTTRYGETTLRVTTSNQPFQFSTVILLENFGFNETLELYCASNWGGDQVKFQDVQIFADTK